MKQVIFKVLSVFVAVVAVAMMGTALATFWVHPDVRTEMNTPAMQNYTFTFAGGENPTWTVTRRFSTDPANPNDRGNVGQVKTAYEALIKAHGDLKNYLGQQSSALAADKAKADEETAAFKASQEQDVQAMKARADYLAVIAEAKGREAREKSQELETLSVKSREIRDETAARRTDVLRLRHELEEARTDLFRLNAVRRDLTDRLVRLEIENDELKTRQAQISGESSSPSATEFDQKQGN